VRVCISPWVHFGRVLSGLAVALVQFVKASVRSRTALAAENLFLRKQLALFRERQIKPRRASDPLRLTLVLLTRAFAWRAALTIVQPATLLRWHREAFRLVWRWRSRPGRPRLPVDLQRLIARMARDNPTWGEERIAAELLVKLGIRVSPRTVRRYMDRTSGGGGVHSCTNGQRWATFVRNHAQALVACDFCVVVTATFRILYVFVALEVGSRRLLHINATAHPTAVWTLQQFREILAEPHAYRFVLHDRDSIYSAWLDAALSAMGVRVLRTPVQAPQAKDYASHCTSLAGSGGTSGMRRRWDNFTPWALRGGWAPGCSYSHSGLAVYA
jgi:putative transposase